MKITPSYVGHEPGREKSPWKLTYYVDRKPVREFFPSRSQRDERITELRALFRNGANPEDVTTAIRTVAGTGYSLTQLAQMGLAAIRANGATRASATTTFEDATKMVITRAKKKNRRLPTIAAYKWGYAVLNRTFGPRVASMITEDEIEKYLDSLPNIKGEPGKATPETKRTVLTQIRTALRIIGVERPFPNVVVPEAGDKTVRFFTPEQCRLMFEYARPEERGALAIALFVALRPTLIGRLPIECVDVERRTITIPFELAKDRVGHTLEGEFTRSDGKLIFGLHEVVWEWLRAFPYKPVPWAPFQKRMRKALGKAWIHDGTRHTGATYYAALYNKDSARSLLTHESNSMATRRYIGTTTRATAELFYGLKPDQFRGYFRANRKCAPVNWPTDQELAKLVQQMPTIQLAQKLGCSDVAIAKRCKKLGISKPGPGEWEKRQAQNRKPAGELPVGDASEEKCA